MNVERLRAVVDAIEAQPQAFNMELWHCDTHACFAGHAVDLMAKEQGLPVAIIRPPGAKWSFECQVGHGPVRRWSDVAAKYLDLDSEESNLLFDPECWPDQFHDAYYNAQDEDDAAGMVGALRARVEHFIETGK
jgi:hypothetical protein